MLRQSAMPVLETLESVYNLVPPAIKYGRHYRSMLSLYKESDTWTLDQLRSYQEARLKDLIDHAYANVPYYNELFKANRLHPEDFKSLDDLPKIPFLTSEIIAHRWKDLTARNVSRFNRELAHTSGSSGPKLYFYFDSTTIPVERAQALRQLLWLNYSKGDSVAVVKGQPLTNPGTLFKYLPGSKELRIALVQTDDRSIQRIVNELNRRQPEYLRGWPSCLYLIARWLEANTISIKPPKFILTSSENLYPHVKRQLEETFGAKVIDSYGQTEIVAYALQCHLGTNYHVQMETSVVELIPYQGELSEIVGTCLWNKAMPFIRYRTGDLARGRSAPCECGRQSMLLAEVLGRTSDVVLRKEGSPGGPDLSQCSFYNRNEIRETQLVLEEPNVLRVRVVPRTTITPELVEIIRRDITNCGEMSKMEIIVEEVDMILPLEGGKRPLIVGRSPSR